MRRLLLALALLSLAAPATATTFYVAATGGNDSNTCVQAQSLATPRATVQGGINCMASGDTLRIRTGTYTRPTSNPPAAASWAAATTIAAYNSEVVTLRGWPAMNTASQAYFIFDGIIFDATGMGFNEVVYIDNAANHIRLIRCQVMGSAGTAGLALYGTGGAHELIDSRIHHNGVSTQFDHGVYTHSPNNVFQNNEVDHNAATGLQFYNGGVDKGQQTVTQNRIHDNATGIQIWDTTNSIVTNNAIYANTTGQGMSVTRSPGIKIWNNSITGSVYGIDLNSTSTGSFIQNNILWGNTVNINDPSSVATKDHNLCNSGCAVNSNPQFVSATNLAIQATSPAIDQGSTIATVTVDQAGLTRPKGTAYDIGAYEFNTPAAPLISTNRSLDWSVAGTTIQTRSTICTTLQPPSSSAAINSAIANCGAGQVVKLAAGTFTINGGLNISRNDVTLRGSGPTQTTLALQSYDSCNGLGAGICVTGAGTVPFPPDSPRNLANWTAGFAKGATAITLSSVANLQVGSTIILDQLDDSTPDFNGIANCANRTGAQAAWCSGEGANNLSMDSQRVQHETHKVVSIAGNVVTITPALAWPNWSLSKTPHAWWGSSLPVTGVGIEDLKLDATNEGCGAFFNSCGGILMFYAADSWVKNVEVFKMAISQIKLYESRNITLRDNYIHTSKSQTSGAYGLLLFYSSYVLVENNIFQDIVAGALLHGVGNVVGYNYMLDDTYNPGGNTFPPGNFQMQAGMYHHNGGAGYELWEGNDANSFKADAIHGTSNLTTVFRNRLSGYETLKDQHTNPVFVYAWNRYFNFLGNVLGTSTYHTTSGTYASSFNQVAIFRFGETPNYCPWAGSSGGGCTVTGGFTDARVAATSMRWGNYDTVHAANQFVSAEVPSGDANYPNTVPSSQTLPTSLYRSTTAPTWWATPWGTPGYPAIGPDVTGGSIAGLAGHAQKIPARLCYENMSHTTTGSSTGTIQLISNFNADVCYPTTGSPTDTTPPVVTITTNSGTNFTVTDPLLTTLAGGAVDDIQVMFDCRWTNDANAGAGTAPGAFSWSVASIPLALGQNPITVYCHDAANNEGSDTITVTLAAQPPSGPFYRLRIGG